MVSQEMYEELLQVDQSLHKILSSFSREDNNLSLRQLQEHIQKSLSSITGDPTELVRQWRERSYE